MTELPQITKDPMYQLLRVDNVKAFNISKEAGKTCDLRCVNLRGLDLRGLDADGLDFTDSYMRDADLRGVDFSKAILRGVNIRGANISGTYFPCELSPEEIRLSNESGTRMRYHPLCSEKAAERVAAEEAVWKEPAAPEAKTPEAEPEPDQ